MHGIRKAIGIAASSVLFALVLYSLLAAPGFLSQGGSATGQWQAQR